MKIAILIALPFISSCGDDIIINARNESPGEPITFTVKAPPLLVAYRGADESEWKPAEMVDSTTFQFFASGPYLLTIVCRDPDDYLWVQQIAQTPSAPGIPVWCQHDENSNRLTGRSVQHASIWVNNGIDVSDETTPFEFQVPTGTFDVIAKAADRIAIRRRIKVEGDTAITNPIDIMSEGAAFVPIVLSISNQLPSEEYRVSHRLRSQFGFYWGPGTELDKTLIVPNSVLEPADVQYVAVHTSSHHEGRSVSREYREGDSTVFTLPEAMGPVTFTQTGDTLTATWSTLPEHDQLFYDASGLSAKTSLFVSYDAIISKEFEISTGITALKFDTSIPGYQPEWHIDLTKEYTLGLSAQHHMESDTFGSSRGMSVNVPPATEPGGELPDDPSPLRARHGFLP